MELSTLALGTGMTDEQGLAEKRRNSSNPDVKLSQIYRDQWEDYLTRFVPYEDELIDTYDNPQVHARIMDEAVDKAQSGFDAAQGTYSRTVARYGMSPDAQTRAETDRAFNLGRTGAMVDAKNLTRQGLAERDAQMLSGGITTGGMKKEAL